MFVVRDETVEPLAAVDWVYNAWGGKYPPYGDDNAIPAAMAAILGVPRFRSGMVLEGGSIDTNGPGLLMTTGSCLLNPNRNPGISRDAVESCLKQMLGIDRVYWLGGDIAGDIPTAISTTWRGSSREMSW